MSDLSKVSTDDCTRNQAGEKETLLARLRAAFTTATITEFPWGFRVAQTGDHLAMSMDFRVTEEEEEEEEESDEEQYENTANCRCDHCGDCTDLTSNCLHEKPCRCEDEEDE